MMLLKNSYVHDNTGCNGWVRAVAVSAHGRKVGGISMFTKLLWKMIAINWITEPIRWRMHVQPPSPNEILNMHSLLDFYYFLYLLFIINKI